MNQAPHWFASSVMGRLAAAYSGWHCPVSTIQAFWDVLGDLPRQDIERATIAHCATETAWPVPARIRKLALDRPTEQGLTAGEAWAELYKNRHDRRHAPIWSTPAVRRAAEAVNWTDPNWTTDQIPTIRAQFERYFLAAQTKESQAQIHDTAAKLLGMASEPRGSEPRQLFAPAERQP